MSENRKAARYLSVSFGDNDFGGIVITALKRIWQWVQTNNAHCVGSAHPRTVPQMFRKLHTAKALITMIERMCDVEHMASDVEFATRGLYWKKVEWSEKCITSKFAQLNYLSFGLKFYRDKTFTKKWKNGEVAWLDFETGDAETF